MWLKRLHIPKWQVIDLVGTPEFCPNFHPKSCIDIATTQAVVQGSVHAQRSVFGNKSCSLQTDFQSP